MFKKIKEIQSKDGVVHFRRWRVFSTPWFTVNIHGIYHRDEDQHLHNHPWDFFSVVLKGYYTERLEGNRKKIRFPGHMARRKKDAFHKIDSLHSKSVYTLNIMWNADEGNWGYKVKGEFVHHEAYRELKRKGEL